MLRLALAMFTPEDDGDPPAACRLGNPIVSAAFTLAAARDRLTPSKQHPARCVHAFAHPIR